MQEKLLDKPHIHPALSAFDRIHNDMLVFGYCSENTKKQIIDEEMTHAAEILSVGNIEADIPRTYRVGEEGLSDDYGVCLSNVLDRGISYLEDSAVKKSGWDWELKRRKIEKENLKNIIAAPIGIACVEISPTDITKPANELRNYGYTGDTLLRVSFRVSEKQLVQRNIIIRTSDLKILNKLRIHIDNRDCASNNAEEFLAGMLYVSIDNHNFESFIANTKNFISNEIAKEKPASFIASLIRRAKKTTNNSWEIINNHADLFNAMYQKFEELAQNKHADEDSVNRIRAGVWQLLRDASRPEGPHHGEMYSIDSGIAKARAVGAVFTSCGGTVSFDKELTASATGYFDRFDTIKMLLGKISGTGSCRSCGAEGMIYGCGAYCKSCNKVWCSVYLDSGKQLSHKEVFEKQYYSFFRLWLFT